MNPPIDTGGEAAADELRQRLRELPGEFAPPFDWDEFQRRVNRTRRHMAIPLAACVALVILAGALWIRVLAPVSLTPTAELARAWHPNGRFAPPGAFPPPPASALAARAEEAERWLASYPDGSAIVHVSTRIAIAGLEDRIASMDDQLNAAQLLNTPDAQIGRMRLQRARLIADLVQVRYAESLAADAR